MNVFFDVQGTLVSGGVPRPHIREVFVEISGMGHHIYLWSSGGRGYAEQAARVLGISDLVLDCYGKAGGLPVTVDFVVDDQPGVTGRRGELTVSPFDGAPDDEELWQAVEKLRHEAI